MSKYNTIPNNIDLSNEEQTKTLIADPKTHPDVLHQIATTPASKATKDFGGEDYHYDLLATNRPDIKAETLKHIFDKGGLYQSDAVAHPNFPNADRVSYIKNRLKNKDHVYDKVLAATTWSDKDRDEAEQLHLNNVFRADKEIPEHVFDHSEDHYIGILKDPEAFVKKFGRFKDTYDRQNKALYYAATGLANKKGVSEKGLHHATEAYAKAFQISNTHEHRDSVGSEFLGFLKKHPVPSKALDSAYAELGSGPATAEARKAIIEHSNISAATIKTIIKNGTDSEEAFSSPKLTSTDLEKYLPKIESRSDIRGVAKNPNITPKIAKNILSTKLGQTQDIALTLLENKNSGAENHDEAYKVCVNDGAFAEIIRSPNVAKQYKVKALQDGPSNVAETYYNEAQFEDSGKDPDLAKLAWDKADTRLKTKMKKAGFVLNFLSSAYDAGEVKDSDILEQKIKPSPEHAHQFHEVLGKISKKIKKAYDKTKITSKQVESIRTLLDHPMITHEDKKEHLDAIKAQYGQWGEGGEIFVTELSIKHPEMRDEVLSKLTEDSPMANSLHSILSKEKQDRYRAVPEVDIDIDYLNKLKDHPAMQSDAVQTHIFKRGAGTPEEFHSKLSPFSKCEYVKNNDYPIKHLYRPEDKDKWTKIITDSMFNFQTDNDLSLVVEEDDETRGDRAGEVFRRLADPDENALTPDEAHEFLHNTFATVAMSDEFAQKFIGNINRKSFPEKTKIAFLHGEYNAIYSKSPEWINNLVSPDFEANPDDYVPHLTDKTPITMLEEISDNLTANKTVLPIAKKIYEIHSAFGINGIMRSLITTDFPTIRNEVASLSLNADQNIKDNDTFNLYKTMFVDNDHIKMVEDGQIQTEDIGAILRVSGRVQSASADCNEIISKLRKAGHISDADFAGFAATNISAYLTSIKSISREDIIHERQNILSRLISDPQFKHGHFEELPEDMARHILEFSSEDTSKVIAKSLESCQTKKEYDHLLQVFKETNPAVSTMLNDRLEDEGVSKETKDKIVSSLFLHENVKDFKNWGIKSPSNYVSAALNSIDPEIALKCLLHAGSHEAGTEYLKIVGDQELFLMTNANLFHKENYQAYKQRILSMLSGPDADLISAQSLDAALFDSINNNNETLADRIDLFIQARQNLDEKEGNTPRLTETLGMTRNFMGRFNVAGHPEVVDTVKKHVLSGGLTLSTIPKLTAHYFLNDKNIIQSVAEKIKSMPDGENFEDLVRFDNCDSDLTPILEAANSEDSINLIQRLLSREIPIKETELSTIQSKVTRSDVMSLVEPRFHGSVRTPLSDNLKTLIKTTHGGLDDPLMSMILAADNPEHVDSFIKNWNASDDTVRASIIGMYGSTHVMSSLATNSKHRVLPMMRIISSLEGLGAKSENQAFYVQNILKDNNLTTVKPQEWPELLKTIPNLIDYCSATNIPSAHLDDYSFEVRTGEQESGHLNRVLKVLGKFGDVNACASKFAEFYGEHCSDARDIDSDAYVKALIHHPHMGRYCKTEIGKTIFENHVVNSYPATAFWATNGWSGPDGIHAFLDHDEFDESENSTFNDICKTEHISIDHIKKFKEKTKTRIDTTLGVLAKNQSLSKECYDYVKQLYSELQVNDTSALLSSPHAKWDEVKDVMGNSPIMFTNGSEIKHPAVWNPVHGPAILAKVLDWPNKERAFETKSIQRLKELLSSIETISSDWAQIKAKNPKLENYPEVKELIKEGSGKITKERVIEKLREHKQRGFNLSKSVWTGIQRHSEHTNKVVQFNVSPEMMSEIAKDPKRHKFFCDHQKMVNSGTRRTIGSHPQTPWSYGWFRYEDQSIPDAWIVEEHQSDFKRATMTIADRMATDRKSMGHLMNGTYYDGSETRKHVAEVEKIVGDFYRTSYSTAEDEARKAGKKEIYVHGKEIRSCLSNVDPEESSSIQHIYDEMPRMFGYEEVDYNTIPNYNTQLHQEAMSKYKRAKIWRKKL